MMERSLPEAALSVIDWGRLKSGDADEGARLLAACDDQGFFYLNLSSEPAFLQDHKSVLHLMNEYFHQGLAEKMKDDRQSDTHG
jgi:isopenicillin N synthase-like dioxygenase